MLVCIFLSLNQLLGMLKEVETKLNKQEGKREKRIKTRNIHHIACLSEEQMTYQECTDHFNTKAHIAGDTDNAN